MQRATVNGTELEYAVTGTGDPLLLISPGPIADGFHPLLSEKSLTDRYRIVTYHQRGQAGSRKLDGVVRFEEHAADAAALLRELGIDRAHVGGHSSGALVTLQLALDQPSLVHTLVLLEPPLMSVPSAPGFFESVGPALAAYARGERSNAMAKFLSVVSGLDWDTCRSVIDHHVPNGVAQALKDAETFFGSYLVALGEWKFDETAAATITQPVLSVLGTQTLPVFVDSHALLEAWLPQLEEAVIDGAGHLLQLQQPTRVASSIATWLSTHPMYGAHLPAEGKAIHHPPPRR